MYRIACRACEQGVRLVNVAKVTDKMLATETNRNNISTNYAGLMKRKCNIIGTFNTQTLMQTL